VAGGQGQRSCILFAGVAETGLFVYQHETIEARLLLVPGASAHRLGAAKRRSIRRLLVSGAQVQEC
jgi:hypothetical protein